MLEPTAVTWCLVLFGLITCLPLFAAQLVMLVAPHGERARAIMIGKGKDWRDRTHFRAAYGCSWADWLLAFPLLAAGSLAVLLGRPWGYVSWSAAGAMQVFINTVLWFIEKEDVYPSRGPLRYYTYYWGFFVYWGVLSIVYSAIRLSGITI